MATVIPFARVAPVYGALRTRAQVDRVPTPVFHKAIAQAVSLLKAGRSPALAVSEGCRLMRPQRTPLRTPEDAA